MPQSLFQSYMHIVFSTKKRRPWLDDREIRQEMHAYLAGACKQNGCPPLIVDGFHDHVHLLVRMGKTALAPRLIGVIKESSSKWIKAKSPFFADFYWQSGYGCFGVSGAHVARVRQYIENQEIHHRAVSFQDEFRSILAHNGLECDERYVWD